jgi:hypothetical protein
MTDLTLTQHLARNTAFVATYGDEITARKGDIIALAVAYSQFMDAATAGRLFDAKKFATDLDALQTKVGVTLTSMNTLRDYL